MNSSHAWTKVHVPARSTRLIEGGAGAELYCLSGSAWITQYGDDRDLVLRAGQRVVLDLPTAIVSSSCGGAELLSRPAPPASRRGSGWMRRLLAGFDPRWSGAAARSLSGRIGRAGT